MEEKKQGGTGIKIEGRVREDRHKEEPKETCLVRKGQNEKREDIRREMAV
jgi:hypothetical protein